MNNSDPVGAVKSILQKGQPQSKGAFLAENNDDNKKKFSEMIAAAYNGANGYVSPPSNNIMGFGPASQQIT